MPLSERHWYNKLIFLYKIVNILLPYYLHSYLGFPSSDEYPLRSSFATKVTSRPSQTKTFKKSFFPNCINKWNNLMPEVRNAKSICVFKKLLGSVKSKNSLFSIYDLPVVKLKVPFIFYSKTKTLP